MNMISSTAFLRAAEDTTSSLMNYGLAGAVLAVFVVPLFYGMARNAQKREDARIALDQEERKSRLDRENREAELRAERERKLVDALVASVEQQKLALEQWRRFEEQEEKTHAALLNGFAQISERMASQQQHSATTATAQTQLAQLLGEVAAQIQNLKRTA
jgi:hypothetical protein